MREAGHFISRDPKSIRLLEHDWSAPLQRIALQDIDERARIFRHQLDRLIEQFSRYERYRNRNQDRAPQRHNRRAAPSEEDLYKRADALVEVLTAAPPYPAFSPLPKDPNTALEGAWELPDTPPKPARAATNVGFEVEVTGFAVEAKLGKQRIPVLFFLLKAMLDEHPPVFGSFSVQSDGGRIELVSDPPKPTVAPADTVASMAAYINELKARFASPGAASNPLAQWREVTTAEPDENGKHPILQHRGEPFKVRVAKRDWEIDGTFHATVGLHLSAIPWLFACANAEPRSPTEFPLRGHVFPRRENPSWDDRRYVLERMEALRRKAHQTRRWRLSPEFEGFAYLVFAYIAAAHTPHPPGKFNKRLSPKQLFFVLARTDFVTLLKQTPEAAQRRTLSRSRLKSALLDALPQGHAMRPMFTDRFGDSALSIDEVLAALKDKNDLNAASKDKHDHNATHRPITLTAQQWLDRMFADEEPADVLTPDYQEDRQWHANQLGRPLPADAGIEPNLLRGMGALGEKMDEIPSRDRKRKLNAPLFELRRITPDGALPKLAQWQGVAEQIVAVVTALNAPATEADLQEAADQLEWIRRSGVPRSGHNAGARTRAASAEVDDICLEISWQIGRAETRASLWTLLDRARTFVRTGDQVHRK